MLKTQRSDLDYYRGLLFLRRGDMERGRYYLEQALVKWPHEKNKAYAELHLFTQ